MSRASCSLANNLIPFQYEGYQEDNGAGEDYHWAGGEAKGIGQQDAADQTDQADESRTESVMAQTAGDVA